jgi:hypothetical protein
MRKAGRPRAGPFISFNRCVKLLVSDEAQLVDVFAPAEA